MATRGLIRATRPGAEHGSFLRYAGFRWLKLSALLCLVALVGYVLADVQPRPSGGSWYGYTLGTVATLLILWLTLLGLRKRRMTRGRWSLKAWASAHVYLGLAVVVIATLHTGFQLGWNIHTLAYALMMVVVVSGLFGVFAYAALPRALSDNRGETTETQMLDNLRLLDRQLHDAAQPLDERHAGIVRASLEADPFAGGLAARLTGRYPRCATAAAQGAIRRETGPALGDALDKVDGLLGRKLASLDRIRRHLRIKALLEVWLYLHVPFTFALIAALTAHIVSVFFYW